MVCSNRLMSASNFDLSAFDMMILNTELPPCFANLQLSPACLFTISFFRDLSSLIFLIPTIRFSFPSFFAKNFIATAYPFNFFGIIGFSPARIRISFMV